MNTAKRITEWLIERGAIRSEDEELYIFAICNTFLTFVPMISVMFLAYIMGSLVEGITLVIPFLTIRKFSGGFHFDSAIKCMITTVALLILLLLFTIRITLITVFDISILLAGISLSINSPIDSEARRLDEEEKAHFKKTACIISVIYISIYFTLRAVNVISGYSLPMRIAKSIASGMILGALLQLPVLIAGFLHSGRADTE